MNKIQNKLESKINNSSASIKNQKEILIHLSNQKFPNQNESIRSEPY